MEDSIKAINIVFLYSRLPDYFYQCVKYLVANYPVKATIIRYTEDKNAPFHFESFSYLDVIYKSDFSSNELLNFVLKLNPDVIYCAGWIDKEYLKIVRTYTKRIPLILGFDNPWIGSIKQILAPVFSKLAIQPLFTHCWIPGKPQLKLAVKLGFKKDQILKGLYVADLVKFKSLPAPNEKKRSPKKLLFVGRLVQYKNPILLISTFLGLEKSNQLNGWHLELIGNGPLKSELVELASESKGIHISAFIPPDELRIKFSESGAFCLPSENEHWGVVIQEAAASGLPIIISDTCHAGSEFLVENYNGFRFKTKSKKELKEVLLSLFNLSQNELIEFGLRSRQLSEKINHDLWAKNLLSVIHE